MKFEDILFLADTPEMQDAIYQIATHLPDYDNRIKRYADALHPSEFSGLDQTLWEVKDAINAVSALQEKAAFICGMQFSWNLFRSME